MYMLLIWLAVVSLLTVALGESWTWWMSTVLFYLLNIHTKTDATGKNWWTLDMSQLMTKTLSGMGFFHHLTEICQFGSSKVQGLFWRYVQILRYTFLGYFILRLFSAFLSGFWFLFQNSTLSLGMLANYH